MLKFEKIIRNLTLEEKVTLITTKNWKENQKLKYFDLPQFRITTENEELSEDGAVNPSYNSLASTWNPELIQAMGYKIASDKKKVHEKEVIGVPFTVLSDKDSYAFGSDITFERKVSEAFLKGIHDASYPSAYSVVPTGSDSPLYRTDVIFQYEETLRHVHPSLAILEGKAINHVSYDENTELGLICKNETDLIKGIKAKACYFECDFDAVKVVKAALDRYKSETEKYKNHELSRVEYQSLLREGVLLSEEELDEAIDHLLGFLRILKTESENLAEHESVKNLGRKLAEESIVLLKNNDVLPLDSKAEVALIGAAVEDGLCADGKRISDSFATIENLKSLLEKNKFRISGFAHGYTMNDETDAALVEKAVTLVKNSDCALVVLENEKGSNRIPKAQLALLKMLAKTGKKIVALVLTDTPVDVTFAKICDGVLYTGYPYDGMFDALLDILSGIVSPSGRLTYPLMSQNEILYPFGYGMSYATFEYQNFSVDKNCMSVTIKNTGTLMGSDVVSLYVDGKFKGFRKVALRGGEISRVSIPFDDNTFLYYSEKDKCYGVLGGVKKLTCSKYDGGILFETDVTVEGALMNPNGFTNEKMNDDLNEFTDVKKNEFIKKNHEPIARWKKIVPLAVITVYVYVMMGILCYRGWLYDNYGLMGISIALMVIYGIAAVLFLVFKIILTKNPTKEDKSTVDLSMKLDSMKEFDVVAQESFKEPLSDVTQVSTVEDELADAVAEVESEEMKNEEVTDAPTEEEIVEESPEATASEEENEEAKEESETEETQEAEAREEVAEEATAEEPEEDDDDEEDEEEAAVYDEYATEVEEVKEVVEEKNYVCDIFGETVTDNLTYSDVDISKVSDDFCKFAAMNGLVIEPDSSRSLFASLVGTHIIFLKTATEDLSIKLTDILERYLGNTEASYFYARISSSIEKFHDLVWYVDEDDEYMPTEFLNYLLTAKGLSKHTNIMTFSNINLANLMTYFRPFVRYSASPSDEHKLDLQIESYKYIIPNNIYAILIPKDPAFLEDMNPVFLGASLYLELQVHECAPYEDPSYKREYFSYFRFCDEVRLGKEKNYIEEDVWKKIDDFEDAMAEYEGHFRIGNKKTLIFERMASYMLMNGADKDDVLDTCFSCNIVPILKTLRTYKADKGDETILKILDNIFGLDILPKTSRALKKQERVEVTYDDEEEYEEEEVEEVTEDSTESEESSETEETIEEADREEETVTEENATEEEPVESTTEDSEETTEVETPEETEDAPTEEEHEEVSEETADAPAQEEEPKENSDNLNDAFSDYMNSLEEKESEETDENQDNNTQE